MMKQLYIFALAQIVSIVPALASVSVSPELPTAGDKQQLGTLETKFFSHEDVNRLLNQRLDNIESFVFGSPTTGSFHQRLTRISDTCSKEQTAASQRAVAAARTISPSQTTPVAHQPRIRTYPTLTTYEFDDNEAINARPAVQFQKAAAVRQTVTVVDRIEWMELSIFGHKDCAAKIQKRVAKLESSIYGSNPQVSDSSITARVNKLWYAVNASS